MLTQPKLKNTSLSRSPLTNFTKNKNSLNNLFSNTRNAMQGSCSQFAQRQLRSSGKVNDTAMRFENSGNSEADKRCLSQHQRKIAESRCGQNYGNSPKQKSAYRSAGRISKLLGVQDAKIKTDDDVYNLLKKKRSTRQQQKEKSECSSATTAYTTIAANGGIVTRGMKQQTEGHQRLTGQKRRAKIPTQVIEEETKVHTQMSKSQNIYVQNYTPFPKNFSPTDELCSPGSIIDIQEFDSAQTSGKQSKSAKTEISELEEKPHTKFRLKNKKTGEVKVYRLYNELDLDFLRAQIDNKKLILDFNMNKLELEYDYDTDEEQLKAAKEMLMQENISAVEFTIKEDPILLVGNLSCYNI